MHTTTYCATFDDMYHANPRNRRGSGASDTHGTYIYDILPENGRLYHNQDPTECGCRCCPHPRLRSDSINSPAMPNGSHRYDPMGYGVRYSDGRASSKASRHHAYGYDYYREGHRHHLGKDYTYRRANRDQKGYRPSSYMHADRAKKSKRLADHDRIIVDVVDRTSSQALSSRYGKHFPLSISPRNTTVRDVSMLLAPDARQEHVVVKWRNGEVEPFDDLVPLSDLDRQGTRLEVRTRKRVHWS